MLHSTPKRRDGDHDARLCWLFLVPDVFLLFTLFKDRCRSKKNHVVLNLLVMGTSNHSIERSFWRSRMHLDGEPYMCESFLPPTYWELTMLPRISLDRQHVGSFVLSFMVVVVFVGGSTLVASEAHASNCASVRDSDQRALCRAKAEKKSSACASISDSDLRNYCRAVVSEQSSACASVRDSDLRNQCRAESQGKSSTCASIRDNDKRQFCRAKAEGRSSTCASIRDSDQRNYCRAVVDKRASTCASIRDSDLRNQCRSEAK